MKIEPVNPDFAATVSDVDLSQHLPDDIVAGIEQAMARYAVLVFHDQPMTDDQHAAFTRRFGPIDKGLLLGSKRKQRLTNAEVIDLANVDPDGVVLPASHIRNVSLIANQFWHSDSSFKNPPAKYSILCGMDLPAQGGQTEFADQRAAYDALSDDMKVRIDGTRCRQPTPTVRVGQMIPCGEAYAATLTRTSMKWRLARRQAR